MTTKRFFVYPQYLAAALAVLTAVLALAITPTAALAAVGDAYVYRVINRYTGEARGDITYLVDKVEANRIITSVSSQNSLVEAGRTAIFSSDGNWVRHVIDSHGFQQTIEFSAESPAYAFPLAVGRRWSMRAPARVVQTGKTRSVRIDAEVVSAERIRVPAGEFDTLKINRIIYGGDADGFETETHISQTEWYAPALRRTVKIEARSSHMDMRIGRGNRVVRGDWDLHELVEVRPAQTRIQ